MKLKSNSPGKRSATPKKGAKSIASTSMQSANGIAPVAATEVLTIHETAAFLRVAEEEVRRSAAAGMIPAKMVGNEWRFLKSALTAWLSSPQAQPEPFDWRESNRRVLETFGAMADDDTIPEMLGNIYKERKRNPLSEILD